MIGIVTITDNFNLGNRLQNYATAYILSRHGKVKSIRRFYSAENMSKQSIIKRIIKSRIKYMLRLKKHQRENNFTWFNKKIKFSSLFFSNKADYKRINRAFDYFVSGSDQVWNPTFEGNGMFINMLGFVDDPSKKIALAPSIGIGALTPEQQSEFKKYLLDYKALSCREEQGSKIIKEITKKECITLVDPTLMLTKEEWRKVCRKPKHHDDSKHFILLYFLGTITDEYRKIIKRISEITKLRIINILDKASQYYCCGPAEFIYLIDHADLVLTDSFHGSVFSYLFDKPFKVFSRKDSLKNMESRLINLVKVLKLPNSIFFDAAKDFDGDLFDANVKYDKSLLLLEKEKFEKFLSNSFE